MQIKRNIKVEVFLSFLVVSMFFIFFELFLNFINLNDLIPVPKIYLQFESVPVELFFNQGSYLRDGLLFWKLSPKHPGINVQGFRDKKAFLINKPKDIFRIICLGDSVPFGYTSLAVKTEETYPKLLESILQERSNNKIEVINAAVPGYSSLQGLRYFKRDLLKYEPDLVILHFGPNDTAPALYFSDKEQPIQPDWLMDFRNFLSKSKIYQFFNRFIFCLKYRNRYKYLLKINSQKLVKSRVSYVDYILNLDNFYKLGRQYRFKTIFITPVYYKNEKIGSIYNLPKEGYHVDLFNILKEKENEAKDLFIDQCHLTSKGHQIVAEAIANLIRNEHLISNIKTNN